MSGWYWSRFLKKYRARVEAQSTHRRGLRSMTKISLSPQQSWMNPLTYYRITTIIKMTTIMMITRSCFHWSLDLRLLKIRMLNVVAVLVKKWWLWAKSGKECIVGYYPHTPAVSSSSTIWTIKGRMASKHPCKRCIALRRSARLSSRKSLISGKVYMLISASWRSTPSKLPWSMNILPSKLMSRTSSLRFASVVNFQQSSFGTWSRGFASWP